MLDFFSTNVIMINITVRRCVISDTLVLNSTFEPLSVIPLSIIPWQRAVKLLFLDRVKVLQHYEDWSVHSQKLILPVPAVVMTTEYFNFKKQIRYSKANIFLRDLYQCQYCADTFDVKDLTIDHVVPRAAGGKTSWENCVSSCIECNSKKGALRNMRPLREPHKPDAHSMMFKMKDRPFTIKHPSWAEYLAPYRKIA